jgi:hypothetical protein
MPVARTGVSHVACRRWIYVPSLIAWLDASTEEQRRMRDVIRLFADRESRDELGLGQLRDGISDALFPGTSTLLTRARYLLFVPWVYQLAARSSDPVAKADRLERELIEPLKRSDDNAGLLGTQAGVTLKTLPSSVYWSMLRHYGILRDASLSRADALSFRGGGIPSDAEADPARPATAWSATMPPPPEGFPQVVDGGFRLQPDEAAWLRDRILDTAPGSYLAHLTQHSPDPNSPSPWADPASASTGTEVRLLLDHARAFSAVVHGAQLLYNLMIAEEYEQRPLQRVDNPVARYRDELDEWASRLPVAVDLHAWRFEELVTHIEVDRGSPIHPSTRRFVTEWLGMLRASMPATLAGNERARHLIRTREKHNKGAQTRLGNPRRLATWGGGSGAGALVFRWPTVRTILIDIHDGLARREAADA